MAVTWKKLGFNEDITTADSKAVSAAGQATTADSKAVSAQVYADSAADSAAVQASTADSKAVSAAGAGGGGDFLVMQVFS
jgi:hypothetical protein